ncbi:TniQ family protein [Nitrospirillum amazonense]|uniref:TniQ family protein n=1 Tax=Nitrospirillum amazonense TaxID=28077 RepID=UPI002DD42D7F|nr:TniQ family protein [Nitrospirillum amazonense]MEC4591904.1 TniQ family protein [Nitrospirillum amazonense]
MDGELWPGRPTLQADESLSSWFARLAVANGLQPAELHRILQPGGDRSPRDLDRHADFQMLDRLSAQTGITADALERTTFRRWAGYAFERDDGLAKLDWLPPAGRDGAARCFGQQACPLCLAGDAQPYLRLRWRLLFVSVCPVHGCLLIDRCPRCNEPMAILRQQQRGGVSCWSCGFDLRQAETVQPPVDYLPYQNRLLTVLADGWANLGDHVGLYSFMYLKVLALVVRLLTGGPHAYALREQAELREPGLAVPPQSLPRGRDLAVMAPGARTVLVAMAMVLMRDWPNTLAAAADAVGLASSHVRKRHGELLPFAFAQLVDWHLKKPFNAEGRIEVAGLKEMLERQGRKPTYREMVETAGTKLAAMSDMAEPVANGAVWGQGRYWKLDGVSPEVKEAARLMAHRSGQSVGPWLDNLLRQHLNLPAGREKSSKSPIS